jgi:hypothetical protein
VYLPCRGGGQKHLVACGQPRSSQSNASRPRRLSTRAKGSRTATEGTIARIVYPVARWCATPHPTALPASDTQGCCRITELGRAKPEPRGVAEAALKHEACRIVLGRRRGTARSAASRRKRVLCGSVSKIPIRHPSPRGPSPSPLLLALMSAAPGLPMGPPATSFAAPSREQLDVDCSSLVVEVSPPWLWPAASRGACDAYCLCSTYGIGLTGSAGDLCIQEPRQHVRRRGARRRRAPRPRGQRSRDYPPLPQSAEWVGTPRPVSPPVEPMDTSPYPTPHTGARSFIRTTHL